MLSSGTNHSYGSAPNGVKRLCVWGTDMSTLEYREAERRVKTMMFCAMETSKTLPAHGSLPVLDVNTIGEE